MSALEPQDEVLHPQPLPIATEKAPPLPKRSLAEKIFGPPSDTKTIFDSLRNMGICIAMLLGLPSLHKAVYYLPTSSRVAIGCFVIGMVVPLTVANLAWTFRTLEQKSSKIANLFIVVIGCAIVTAFGFQALESLLGL